LPLALLLIVVLLGWVAATGQAQVPDRVKVPMALPGPQGPAARALVRSFGGDVAYTYYLVSAFASTVLHEGIANTARTGSHFTVDKVAYDGFGYDARLNNQSTAALVVP
jgi:hypothetical protein